MRILLVSLLAIPVHLGKYLDAAVPKVIPHICGQYLLEVDWKVPKDSSDDRSNHKHAAKVGAPVQLHSLIGQQCLSDAGENVQPISKPSSIRWSTHEAHPRWGHDWRHFLWRKVAQTKPWLPISISQIKATIKDKRIGAQAAANTRPER